MFAHFIHNFLLREGAIESYEATWSLLVVPMDLTDRLFATDHDCHPQYLREVVTQDFYEFTKHWQNSLSNMEFIAAEGHGHGASNP